MAFTRDLASRGALEYTGILPSLPSRSAAGSCLCLWRETETLQPLGSQFPVFAVLGSCAAEGNRFAVLAAGWSKGYLRGHSQIKVNPYLG